MNIKQAKEQIKNAMTAYFVKDELGSYVIPVERQRPIFLMGPPGVGKTAIMEQVAAELGVGLVTYSMTHHTRQSAIGLPFIVKKSYGGVEYDVSEYTMSEIIASVYDMMESTGVREGILFLDEINCVSETLAPAMLQFLQFKIFGKHKVPDGWIVVTAGNPPEYNNSVREFDIVTWDRLKRIDVEPDFMAWKEYAYLRNVHPAVMSYLEINSGDFYSVATTVDGKTFVTARGWDDLSTMMHIYEKNGIGLDSQGNVGINESLIGQYLQNPKIAKNFAIYYDLFKKYRSDYQIDKILDGTVGDDIISRAKLAPFDEKLSLVGLIMSAISVEVQEVFSVREANEKLVPSLNQANAAMVKKGLAPFEAVNDQILALEKELDNGKRSGSMNKNEQQSIKKAIAALSEQIHLVKNETNARKAFEILKADFTDRVKSGDKLPKSVSQKLENAFAFIEKTFESGQEMTIFVTELTANHHTARFISRYGSTGYFKHNKALLFYERNKEIELVLNELNLDAIEQLDENGNDGQ